MVQNLAMLEKRVISTTFPIKFITGEIGNLLNEMNYVGHY